MAERSTPAPKGLGGGGRHLWRALASAYEFRADELELLEQACRARDSVDELAALAAAANTMVEGHAGQPRLNPLISELRLQRAALAKLLSELQVPDEDEGRGMSAVQRRGQRAAQARWARRDRQQGVG